MTLRLARTTRDLVYVSGPDAASYLQGQLSQDVEKLPAGGLVQSFVLSPQGKVDGWGRVHRVADEEFEIDVDPGAGSVWVERLNRFLLRTAAEISLEEDVDMLAARAGKGEFGIAARLIDDWLPASWPGIGGADLLGEGSTDPAAVLQAIEEGAVEVEWATLDAIRIRSGVPVWGAEIDHDTIPATLGQRIIDQSVSFTKGCFTGQELVARIDSRGGHVPKLLHGVEIHGGSPEPGAEVSVGDEFVGTITSAAPDNEVGSVGLVFVPRAFEVPVGGVECDVDGTPSRLVHLPNVIGETPGPAAKPAWRPFA
jgi:folate-binding protein YgfZ